MGGSSQFLDDGDDDLYIFPNMFCHFGWVVPIFGSSVFTCLSNPNWAFVNDSFTLFCCFVFLPQINLMGKCYICLIWFSVRNVWKKEKIYFRCFKCSLIFILWLVKHVVNKHRWCKCQVSRFSRFLSEHRKRRNKPEGLPRCTLCSVTRSKSLPSELHACTRMAGVNHAKDIMFCDCRHILWHVCVRPWRRKIRQGQCLGCRVVLFMASVACTTGNPLNSGRSFHSGCSRSLIPPYCDGTDLSLKW